MTKTVLQRITTEWHADVPAHSKPEILQEFKSDGVRYYKAKKPDGTIATFQADIFDNTWNTKPEPIKRKYHKGKNPNSFNELIEEND